MLECIPMLTGEESGELAKRAFADAVCFRIPLDRIDRFVKPPETASRCWIDPGIDGMHDLSGRKDEWHEFMNGFDHFEDCGKTQFLTKPDKAMAAKFVSSVMNACALFKPAWITVPQLPFCDDTSRNKANLELAKAAGKWKSQSKFAGKLILPIVLTHSSQLKGKQERTPRVAQAATRYQESQADGYWVVDQDLTDDSGASTLGNRFKSVIGLHEQLAEKITSKLRIGGPYWGLNLVLWARGLIDYPAFGISSGYKYSLPGGHINTPSTRIAIPSLRRRVKVGPQLKSWLDASIKKIGSSHPNCEELVGIRDNFAQYASPLKAKEQVAMFYSTWVRSIAATTPIGRPIALFQDLASAYAFGKHLPNLDEERSARRPEAVVEPLMLNCL